MSMYSGKCDVADCYDDKSDGYLRKSNFYLGNNIVPLRINNQHDLAPYYPYLVAMSYSDGNMSFIHLSSESFIDAEEKEHLGWILKDFQKYYRKCKRKKISYIEDEAIAKCCWRSPTNIDREIAKRVGEHGDKATIDGLHDNIHEYYRNRLFEKMVELGWDEKTADYWIWKDLKRTYDKYKKQYQSRQG